MATKAPPPPPPPIINPIRTWNLVHPATFMRTASRGDRKASRKPPADPDHDFTGQTVIVTGANTGLGYQAALKFAALHAEKVVLGVRDIEKGETAKARIFESLGSNGDTTQIEVWPLDMLSYTSIKTFAAKAGQSLKRLDIVVLNAAIMPRGERTHYHRFKDKFSEYGWEETMQVNTLSTVFLALSLLPKLRETSATVSRTPVLEFVGSSIYKDITLPPAYIRCPIQTASRNDLLTMSRGQRWKLRDQCRKNHTVHGSGWQSSYPIMRDQVGPKGKEQYDISKYALQCAVSKIARFVEPREVIVTSCCPRECKSDLRRHATLAKRIKFDGKEDKI